MSTLSRTTAALLAVILLSPVASAKRSKGEAKLQQRLVALEALEAARREALTLIRDEARYATGDPGAQRQVNLLTEGVEGAYARVSSLLAADLKMLRRKKNAAALAALEGAGPGRLNPWEQALLRRLADLNVVIANRGLRKTLAAELRPSAFQLEELRLTNDYRMLMGLRPLRFETRLAAAAAGHSEEMRRLRYFDHTSPQADHATPSLRAEKAGFEGSAVGENIAQGYRSPRAVHRGWLESPGHHRNIVDPDWEHMGVAHSSDTWTQVFGRTSPNT